MARLLNKTRGSAIAHDLRSASSHWGRFRGLMLRARLPDGEALLLSGTRSIHMLFMRFSIDAVFVDDALRVTRVARGVRPWIGAARGGRGSRAVIELAAGAARDVQPGDQLEIVEGSD